MKPLHLVLCTSHERMMRQTTAKYLAADMFFFFFFYVYALILRREGGIFETLIVEGFWMALIRSQLCWWSSLRNLNIILSVSNTVKWGFTFVFTVIKPSEDYKLCMLGDCQRVIAIVLDDGRQSTGSHVLPKKSRLECLWRNLGAC